MTSAFLDDLPDLDLPEKPHHKRQPGRKVVLQYVKLRCPKCGSKHVRVYSTRDLPIRHHKCRDCGYNFDSIET